MQPTHRRDRNASDDSQRRVRKGIARNRQQRAREQSRVSVARPINRRRVVQRRSDRPNDYALSPAAARRGDRHACAWLHTLSVARRRDRTSGQMPDRARRFRAKLRPSGGRNAGSTIIACVAFKPRSDRSFFATQHQGCCRQFRQCSNVSCSCDNPV